VISLVYYPSTLFYPKEVVITTHALSLTKVHAGIALRFSLKVQQRFGHVSFFFPHRNQIRTQHIVSGGYQNTTIHASHLVDERTLLPLCNIQSVASPNP
jgi:hypothetical protein